MKVTRNERGFESVEHAVYIEKKDSDTRLVTQSSAIGLYEDAFDKPGSSFLWVGTTHHLNREQVKELATRMLRWVEHNTLCLEEENEEE